MVTALMFQVDDILNLGLILVNMIMESARIYVREIYWQTMKNARTLRESGNNRETPVNI